MGNPVPMTITIRGQRVVVGKTWFDPAGGEIKCLLDENMSAEARAIIFDATIRREYAIVPAPAVISTFERLMTTDPTTSEEGT